MRAGFIQKYLLLLLAAFVLGGCATTQKVTQDFKPGTDYSAYKTFAWRTYSSDVPTSNQIAIQRDIEQQLTLQGLKLVSDKADLLLDINIIQQADTTPSTSVGLSIGLPIGRHGEIGLETNNLLKQGERFVGLIIVDITAGGTNQIVWRGSANDIPLDYFSLKHQQKLQQLLISLIQQFPPK